MVNQLDPVPLGRTVDLDSDLHLGMRQRRDSPWTWAVVSIISPSF